MKYKKINILIFIFLTLSISLLIYYINYSKSNNMASRDFPDIKSSGILNIVTEYNSVDYYVSGDTIQGAQYALSKYIEKKSGLKVNIFLENNLEISFEKLENNEYDVIARSIPITNKIKEQLAFTTPILKDKQVLVQRIKSNSDSDSFIDNQIGLANKTIHVPQNSPVILRIKNLSEEIAEPIYVEENKSYTAEQLIYMVAYHEIDYAVVDLNTATVNQKLFPNIDINTDISFTQLYAWGIRKSSPILLDSLNKWIKEYSNVSKIKKTLRKS